MSDKLLRLSFSQITAFRSCPRRWWARYRHWIREPMSPALVKGDALHKALERWIADPSGNMWPTEGCKFRDAEGNKIEGPWDLELEPAVASRVKLLFDEGIREGIVQQRPGQMVELRMERGFVEGAMITGLIDNLWEEPAGPGRPPQMIFGDHKSAGSTRYLEKVDTIQQNEQLNLYAWLAILEAGLENTPPESVILRHNQFIDDKKSGKISTRVVQAEQRWLGMCQIVGGLQATAREMVEFAKKELPLTSWFTVEGPRDPKACMNYGGCPRIATCHSGAPIPSNDSPSSSKVIPMTINLSAVLSSAPAPVALVAPASVTPEPVTHPVTPSATGPLSPEAQQAGLVLPPWSDGSLVGFTPSGNICPISVQRSGKSAEGYALTINADATVSWVSPEGLGGCSPLIPNWRPPVTKPSTFAHQPKQTKVTIPTEVSTNIPTPAAAAAILPKPAAVASTRRDITVSEVAAAVKEKAATMTDAAGEGKGLTLSESWATCPGATDAPLSGTWETSADKPSSLPKILVCGYGAACMGEGFDVVTVCEAIEAMLADEAAAAGVPSVWSLDAFARRDMMAAKGKALVDALEPGTVLLSFGSTEEKALTAVIARHFDLVIA